MVGVLSDPSLYAVTGGEPPTLGQLEARYARQVLGRSDDGLETWHNWIVRERATGGAVGFVQATVTPTGSGSRAEIAWVVGTPWQGRGFATEAASALVEAMTDGGAAEVVAHVAPGHTASERVAASIGLRRTHVVVDDETRWSSRH